MMKTKVAMAISLAGVLAAGTAAALVNTRVLNGGSSSGLSAAQTQQTVPVDAVTSTVSAAAVPVPAAAAASPPTQAVYAIGDSGTVTLDTAGDVLAIAAVTPAAGWIVTQSEIGDGRDAEVKFQAGSVEVAFQANLLYGVVRTSVESHDLSTPNGPVGTGSGFDDDQHNGAVGGDDDGGDDRGGGDD